LRLLTFKGGIHPHDYKEKSKNSQIKKIATPDFLYLHLSQHTGSPSKPIVEKKEEIKIGQKIAEASGKLSVGLHSPVNGTYMGTTIYAHPLGGMKEAMKIKTNKEDNEPFKENKITEIKNLSKKELISIIKDSGIVGMGGAAFPTYFKLQVPPSKKIKDLIINGIECEPYLTSDYRLMIEQPEKIMKGIDIIRRIVSPKNVWIAIEANKPEALKTLKEISSDFPWAQFAVLKTKYPQGSEKQLIDAVTGREIPEGGLPFDAGAYVQNVGTAFAIYEAVYLGKPLFERVVTLTGDVRHPSNFLAPIGTPFEYLIELSEGVIGKAAKIINGGPLMGIAQSRPEVPVLKGTSGILIQNEKEYTKKSAQTCIRCSACVDACPIKLLPTEINKYIEMDKLEKAKGLGVMSCMECGSCSYVCPANIPLTQQFKIAKNRITKKSK
jgi:Na+-translocating ferredoxin:NAD+ oxidoreductase subunit C